jgi:dUTP pyrophosphatase
MSQIPIKVQRLTPTAQVPGYAHTGPWGDLAADLYASAPHTVAPGKTAAVPTGLALEFPEGYGALIEDRSGLAVRGLTTLAGVIDPGYRGEIRVVLTNLGPTPIHIATGDRIAQLRIVQRLEATFEEVLTLVETDRNTGGFGSTGT